MKLNVLVADDEKPICDWLVYCIQKASEDYEVHVANNGMDALKMVSDLKPDLVITDIRMPGMDGLALIRQIRERFPYATCVILTNHADFSYAQQAISLDAKEYLLKSEMRSSDLERILTEAYRRKQITLQDKMGDVFSGGCIDLYSLYYNEDPEHVRSFLLAQGMSDRVAYRVLCLPKGHNQRDWNLISGIAAEYRRKEEPVVYAVAASSKHHEYVILQTEEDMEPVLTNLVERLQSYSRDVGISQCFLEIGKMRAAMQEASIAYDSCFFENMVRPVYYLHLCTGTLLDWDLLKEKRSETIQLLRRRKFAEAKTMLMECFHMLRHPSAQEVRSAMEFCLRTVLLVDENSETSQRLTGGMTVTWDDCRNHCMIVIEEAFRQAEKQEQPVMEKALCYIHEHYAEKLSLSEVARQVYLSPEYFSRQFKEQVGENFSAYLTMYRLERGRDLVKNTDLSIGEIAQKTGYNAAGYFVMQYRKYFGRAPMQDRKSK